MNFQLPLPVVYENNQSINLNPILSKHGIYQRTNNNEDIIDKFIVSQVVEFTKREHESKLRNKYTQLCVTEILMKDTNYKQLN